MGRTLSVEATDRDRLTPHATVRRVADEALRALADEIQEGFVCEDCWQVHPPGKPSSCPTCGAARPAKGWATMPFRLRDAYEFVRLLGRGGQGAVFLARELGGRADHSGRPPVLAVKVVQRTGGEEDVERLREMFAHEAAATGLLGSSPYFVRVAGYDTGTRPHLAMEYVPWPTLHKHLTAGILTPVQTGLLGVALLQAVEVMHFFRVIHRDLKPTNIFVEEGATTHGVGGPASEGYRIKIADLGVWARDSEAAPPEALEREGGVIWGTVPYMSPEQMAGEPVGRRSDLHTAGSILWECATGAVPYPALGDTLRDQVLGRAEALRSAPRRPEMMPPRLYDALATALAHDPARRFGTAQEMMQALRGCLAETTRIGGPVASALVGLDATLVRARELEEASADRPRLLRRLARLTRSAAKLRRHVAAGEAFDHAVVLESLAAARQELADVAAALHDPYAAAIEPAAAAGDAGRPGPDTAVELRADAAPQDGEGAGAAPTVRLRARRDDHAPTSFAAANGAEPSPDSAERYEIVRLVGLGGMSKTYEARDRRLGRRVALKVMHQTQVAGLDDAQQRRLFAAEARAAAGLEHPNTARIFDAGVGADGVPFVAMEYMEGATLAERLEKGGPLPEADALAILEPIASALVEAHGRSVLHRNLKPGRVVLHRVPAAGEIPRVYGFGPPAAEFARLVPQGMLFGTPQYMAPEQAGQQPADATADLYALGSMLFEAVTGSPPFAGPTVVAVMAAKITEDAPPLPDAGPGGPISPGLRAVVAALLQRDPRHRPQRTADVAGWLRALREGRPVHVPPAPTRTAEAPP